jgi:hypothetical protein
MKFIVKTGVVVDGERKEHGPGSIVELAADEAEKLVEDGTLEPIEPKRGLLGGKPKGE